MTPHGAEVEVDAREDVAWIYLNRPARLNAMSGELMTQLRDRLEEAAEDPSVRCVVLSGRGRAFCAGGDADRLAKRPDQVTEMAAALDERIAQLKRHQESSLLLHTMRKPTVAMVNGPAVGGGFALALACDFRIASATARLGVGYARMGISTDFGASYFLQHMVGSAVARELLLLPELMSADEVARLRLVTKVVDPDSLESETTAFAARLAAGPTVALGRTKENLHLAVQASLRTLLDREAENARMSGLYADATEGARAFIEKREPRFTGR